MEKNINQKKSLKWLVLSLSIFILLFFSFVIFLFLSFKDRFYENVSIAQVDLSRNNFFNGEDVLSAKTKSFDSGINVFYKNKKINIPTYKKDDESVVSFFSFDLDNSLNQAKAIGHSSSVVNNFLVFLKSFVFRHNINLDFQLDKIAITEELKNNFKEFEELGVNASYGLDDNNTLIVNQEKIGRKINYDLALEKIENNLATLNNFLVELNTVSDYPAISKNKLVDNLDQANILINKFPIILKYQQNKFTIDKKMAVKWMLIDNNNSLNFDENLVKKYLEEDVASKINRMPKVASLNVNNSKIDEFTLGEDGVEVKIDETYDNFLKILESSNKEIDIVVNKINSEEIGGNNELGIKEIIGTGTSNFSGSSSKRVFNIKKGASTINGILIKPGEEFSLIKALGSIDAKAGYLPELVIKENKTKPEYGGGLCQIGTTLFRAVVDAGLPVTMRRNHSYRVSYYEPAGTDATIYDPLPDFRFLNDTNNYILLQTKVLGVKVIFDLYGQKDGRLIEKGEPVIYNIVKPQPAKLVETTDLKEGQKKCTEKAHNGADAYFTYKVTYSDGTVKDQKFSSHYVPWQEVCLIGVKATSTPAIIIKDKEIAPTATSSTTVMEKNNKVGN